MPIYDRDATDTMYEIKEVRDYDTTTNYIIKEVRDYDETTSFIIYTAQSPDTPTILNGSDQVTAVTGGWTLKNNGGYEYEQGWSDGSSSSGRPAGWYMCYAGNNKNGQGWMYTNDKVEISGYTKLKLTSWYAQGYGDATPGNGYIYVALTTSTSYAGGSYGYATMNGTNIVKSNVVLTDGTNATATIELDVSDVEGSYYVQIGRWNKSANCVYRTAFQTVTFE